ncbi:MAG: hypothetical protein ACHQ17_05520 [Polyangia bacterium]|jgi:hypothetical protein
MAAGSPTGGPSEALSWRVEVHGGTMVARLTGEIDENADFSDLKRQLSGDVELELDGITRVNSCGVREWVNFVRGLDEVTTLRFARCSPTVVLQLNTIYNFRGRARVISFLAPYVCEVCHTDEYKLLEVDEHFRDQLAHPARHSKGGGDSARVAEWHAMVPAFRCGRCGGVMMFDELPERYLSFLSEEGA